MKKILSIVDSAYRATLEEQDDTAVWFSAACKNAGAELTVLFTGNAVNYAVRGVKPDALHFGTAGIPNPVAHDREVERLIEKKMPVYLVREDLEDRGIRVETLVKGIEIVPRAAIPKLMVEHDLIWHW